MAYASVMRVAGNVPVSFISLICKSIPFSARFDVFCIVKVPFRNVKGHLL